MGRDDGRTRRYIARRRMSASVESLLLRARRARWLNVVVVNLRFLIGFAFVPSGLKKLLHQRFTDPENSGPFHEFLHAFHATGHFYQFVGAMQLVVALLLFTQRFATVGALLAMPILTTILVFGWSTAVYPTATVVTLMFLATVGLLLWDLQKWRGIFGSDRVDTQIRITALPPVLDLKLWQGCGVAILALYLAVCALTGEIYRPRRFAPDSLAFYMFPTMLLLPIVTFVVDQVRHRRSRAERVPSAGGHGHDPGASTSSGAVSP